MGMCTIRLFSILMPATPVMRALKLMFEHAWNPFEHLLREPKPWRSLKR